jgi:hypothetical protein
MSAVGHWGPRSTLPGEDYRHTPKLARPEARLVLGSAILKWYDIAPEDAPVPLAIRALARRNLRSAARAGELALTDDRGFVILHRSGESFYFLLASTWRNENELWETAWAKGGDDVSFRPWLVGGRHRPTYCVWELGAVLHERDAWTRFLCSARDEEAMQEYVQDAYEGPV